MSYIIHPVKAEAVNVTASRAFVTTYTNNTGRPILVLLCVIHEVTVQNSYLLVQSQDGGAGSWSGWFNTPAVGIRMYGMLTFMVDAGDTYSVTQNSAGGTNTIIRWTEIEL